MGATMRMACLLLSLSVLCQKVSSDNESASSVATETLDAAVIPVEEVVPATQVPAVDIVHANRTDVEMEPNETVTQPNDGQKTSLPPDSVVIVPTVAKATTAKVGDGTEVADTAEGEDNPGVANGAEGADPAEVADPAKVAAPPEVADGDADGAKVEDTATEAAEVADTAADAAKVTEAAKVTGVPATTQPCAPPNTNDPHLLTTLPNVAQTTILPNGTFQVAGSSDSTTTQMAEAPPQTTITSATDKVVLLGNEGTTKATSTPNHQPVTHGVFISKTDLANTKEDETTATIPKATAAASRTPEPAERIATTILTPTTPTIVEAWPAEANTNPKTFSYSLNSGQEKEEEKELMEVCRRLMGNLKDGNCTLTWRHHNGKLIFDCVEINGKVKTALATQYYEEITKKPTDNKTLIAILASCGALLIMIVILAVCASHHRKPYSENQQHLTEELHTVENGYHDNPTLEVMEVQPEMQEKKVALNGDFNDSWIVPIDNLLKEDVPDEEDTHL
uniref:podocalyxin n=1 Tax=Doryrhamphus excisus TaxID=161450 RepID=UPI0025ADB0A5|nr:podocalyxin [Doryrhamphus excisus]